MERAMPVGDIVFVSYITAAFCLFALALAYGAHRASKKF
jgi:hypothetical protein